MLVERHRGMVLRINDEREGGRVRTSGTTRGIDDERTSEPPAPEALIDSEAADQAGWQHSVTRQAFGFLWRKVGERKAGSGEGIIGDDCPRPVARNEAVAQAPSDILCRQFMQVAVEHRHTAGKLLSDVGCAERFECELALHYGSRIRRRWALAARTSAGDGGGGFRIASAKAR